MTDSMRDASERTNEPFRQMTARARLNELLDSSAVGRLRGDHTRGVAWQAGRPMPAQSRNGVAPGGEATSPSSNATGLINRFWGSRVSGRRRRA
jgi:hypothetical protein